MQQSHNLRRSILRHHPKSVLWGVVFISVFVVGGLMAFPMSQAAPIQPFSETIELNGPMINEVIFSVYHGGGAQWAAMVDGLIDIGNAPISPQERIGIEVNAWEADAFWGIACSTHFEALNPPPA